MTRTTTLAVAMLLGVAPLAHAADAQPKCPDVVAAMEAAGSGVSAEEIAQKLHTTPERVRECWDRKDTDTKAEATGK